MVYAPMEGKIILDSNKKTDPSAPFLRLISTTPMVVSTVSEYDYYALKTDQKVRVYINAEDREIEGTVTGIDELSTVSTVTAMGAGATGTGSAGGVNFTFYVAPEEAIHVDFSVQIKIPLEEIIIPEECILAEEEKEYVLLNKPRGVITTTSDDKNRKTVVDLIPSNKRLYPVGRLDYDTT